MIVWIGPQKFCVVARAIAWTSPRRKAASMDRITAMASCRAAHSASERSRYFSVTISRIGPTFWAMPPWTRTKLSQICCRVWRLTSDSL